MGREQKTEGSWLSIGGLLKSAVTMFVAKDNYEDVMESRKSFMQVKGPELRLPSVCAMSPSDTSVSSAEFQSVDQCYHEQRNVLSVLHKHG